VTATIAVMRAAVAAALAAGALLVGAGCGSTSAATGTRGQDAAALVPTSALAFVSADANLDSAGWKTLRQVYPLSVDPDFVRDFPAAVGDELSLAVLGFDKGKPEAIAIVKSKDKSKLQALAEKYSDGSGDHYTVEDIAGWQVVADSAANFQAVRAASAGTSLADTADFKQAVSELDDGALAFTYAKGTVVQKLHKNLRSLVGTPRSLAARIVSGNDEVRLDVHATGGAHAAAYKPTLLRDAPSDAALAVSFKNANELAALLPSSFLPEVKGISGEGVLYVVPGGLLPIVTLEVQPPDPAAAARSLQALANRVKSNLPLRVRREGVKVLLTNATGNPSSGGSLVDDKKFKDATAAADLPTEVTWLAYADMPRLAPLIQAFSALAGKGQQMSNLKLDKLGTLVAYGAGAGSSSRLVVRTTVR
jgi:hypothetical protein